jgi:late competence protein required for DNA uptake (superfamily II DNA/RNA helicase)
MDGSHNQNRSHSHDPDHHVSISEPSPEELKEIERSHDNFDDKPTGITCSTCQKNEAHYECFPCRCCTYCKQCAMKVATGE